MRTSSTLKLRARKAGIGLLRLTALAMLLAALPGVAQAQPFGAWLTLAGTPQHGYVEIPNHPSLNPTTAFTIEAWVAFSSNAGCTSIAGKGWTESWWIGNCGGTLRSYVKGYENGNPNRTFRDAGVIPNGQWTHVAVVFTGTQRRHFINGELVGFWPESAPLTTSTHPVRIGSDVSFQVTPHAAIDEVRLWSVQRSTAQIRETINEAITTPQPGLVAVWALNGSGADVIGPRDGVVAGSGTGFLTFPVALNCGASTSTSLCLLDRIVVSARFRTGGPGTPEGVAHTVNVANDGSGLFWFFNPDNWEIMVKAINACGVNDRYWVFSAATTNVFYRLEAFDIRAGANKIYFNYSGPPAPAVVDTGAFATCP
jgi:hypothetical protein